MINVIAQTGDKNIATVYVAQNSEGKYLEFAESLQPPLLINEKWVIIISTLFGCVVGCKMCDAGGFFHGKLSKKELFAQIDYLIGTRFPDRKVNCKKFKIQFARMGEPALNPAVLELLDELPSRILAPGFMPSISTVAPYGSEQFFAELIKIKNRHYDRGNFQLQFSIHSTDQTHRDQIIPVKKWDFTTIASYGAEFLTKHDRKIVLNFALAKSSPLDAKVLKHYFDPNKFIIKLTPVNPTIKAQANNIESYFLDGNSEEDKNSLLKKIQAAGFEVLLSIGELEENKIGSNCGQYLRKYLSQQSTTKLPNMYNYDLQKIK